MVRTDRHNHRLVSADSETVQAIKILAGAHQSMIWSRGRQTNGLRSTLREFYPAALVAFDDLASSDALEVLRAAPTPKLGRGRPIMTSPPPWVGVAASVASTNAPLRSMPVASPPARRPPAVSTAMGASVSASVAVISAMVTQIAVLARPLEAVQRRINAEVARSLPGLGDRPRSPSAWRVLQVSRSIPSPARPRLAIWTSRPSPPAGCSRCESV
jgi:hypothetical protein